MKAKRRHSMNMEILIIRESNRKENKMKKLKPNIIDVSGRDLSDEEFAKIEKQYAETGCIGRMSEKSILKK